MSRIRLPIEIILIIVRSVNAEDRKTLASLLHVSRCVHNEIEPLLYQAARFLQLGEPSVTRRLLRFEKTILLRNLALNVKEITIFCHLLPLEAPPNFSPIIPILRRIIVMCPNLKTFKMLYPRITVDDSVLFKDGLLPFSLTDFRYVHTPAFRDPLVRFITYQHGIERLSIPKVHSMKLPREALPRLRCLEGGHGLAIQLLPNRPITHLKITELHTDYINQHPVEILESVRVFSCSALHLDALFYFASLMPNLECLHIGDAHHGWEQVPTLFSQCKTLRRMTWSTVTFFDYPTQFHANWARRCFRASPVLESIEYQQTFSGRYDLWYRDELWWPISVMRRPDWDWAEGWNDEQSS
ncbi:hypothetical protein ONZ45_g9873 [Pleurotus djamor]|nr:hypothetical protein ONZ45_g9873 [Pleurotus djamor]